MALLIQSMIDDQLWKKAKLYAVAYIPHPAKEAPPLVGLMFEDIETGKQIFSQWIDRLTDDDEFEELRVSVVEGKIPGQDSGYAFIVSSNPEVTASRLKRQGDTNEYDLFYVEARIRRMNPEPGSPHLDNFKRLFAKHGAYLLLPLPFNLPNYQNELMDVIRNYIPYGIVKRSVHFKNAEELAQNDPEAVVLRNISSKP